MSDSANAACPAALSRVLHLLTLLQGKKSSKVASRAAGGAAKARASTGSVAPPCAKPAASGRGSAKCSARTPVGAVVVVRCCCCAAAHQTPELHEVLHLVSSKGCFQYIQFCMDVGCAVEAVVSAMGQLAAQVNCWRVFFNQVCGFLSGYSTKRLLLCFLLCCTCAGLWQGGIHQSSIRPRQSLSPRQSSISQGSSSSRR
jgi:hypothetical protein